MYIHHINIKAPIELLEQEKQFFCDALSLHEGYRPTYSNKGYWLYSEDKAIVHLTESKVHFRNERQGFFDHVAFQTKGLKKVVQTLENMNIKYSIGYIAECDMTQIFFKAPSNTKIEVNFINEKI